jgi:hypothetical protein
MPIVVRSFLTFFGVVLLLLGLYLGVALAGESRARGARAANLEPLAAAALQRQAPGAEVLVEGTLSPRNEARFREFVAYVRQEFRGADQNGDDRWVEDERVTPPLLVEASGPVLVANERYEMVGLHERWQEEGLEWSSREQQGTKRYFGLVAGRPVTVIGKVVPAPEGQALAAELVYGGTRAEYIALQQQNAGWLPWFGALFGLVGAAAIFVGLWALRRSR